MRNLDAAQTYSNLIAIYARITEEKLTPAVQAFTQAANNLVNSIRQQAASANTREIQALQRQRDLLLTDLFRGAAIGLSNIDSTIASAANRVNVVLRTYGNPSREPMDTQTRAIDEIIADLSTDSLRPDLDLLPTCKTAIEQLIAANTAFDKLFHDRTIEIKDRERGITARHRLEADAAAEYAADIINSFIKLFNESSLDIIVGEANATLDEARALIHRRAAQRHRKEEKEGTGDLGLGTGGDLKPIDIPPMILGSDSAVPDLSEIPDHIPENNPDPDHHKEHKDF